uniref:AP complex mu/sigma subunit domain-containing protein n=1 Tax=Prolemur simus TaxID=1328070 RepID=A0A8C8YTI4_PROSS
IGPRLPRQGKLPLQKWYVSLSDKEKKKITREIVQTVLARKPKMCSFLEWHDLKIVYIRYASLSLEMWHMSSWTMLCT